jgi:3'-phosphoadenosine 5'-phosphosulfate sulfotransferase (PAPS reductase)/FAD synthetase
MEAIFARHKVAVLLFSGGKDSLACLYLLRPYWERLTVLWVDTGDAFPETRDQMDAVAGMVPHFLHVKSDQPAQVRRNGFPADLLSAWDTPLGHSVEKRTHRVQTPFHCCGENIWLPMDRATRELGATLVIRGQRATESKRAPIHDGTVVEGIEYRLPIEHWTGERVRNYLRDIGVPLPAHYAFVDSSLDCRTCTAYLSENRGKFEYLRRYHSALHDEMQGHLTTIREAAMAELAHLDACRG